MTKKILSPYVMKTIKKAKVQNVKCALRAYQTRKNDPVSGEEQPFIVFYYEISASDGSYKRLLNEQDSIKAFEQLVEFEKRQMAITM